MTTTDLAAPASEPAAAAPLPPADRILAIDVVRGLAVLGILAMNVVEFGLPLRAYTDPSVAGGDTGADLWTWLLQQALFDGRMRALFSMLFGAGLVLIDERMQRSGRGANAADLLLRRCLWLVPFGIAHRFVLQWTGDILYQYGLLGLVAVALRRLRPRTQILAGLLALAAFVPIEAWHHHQLAEQRDQATHATQLAAAGEAVPQELQQARTRWERRSAPRRTADNDAEIAAMRGGYLTVFRFRWDYHHTFQSTYVYEYFVWDVLGMMLVGMGLCRLGFFAGTMRTRSYVLALAGGAVATAISFALSWQQAEAHFSSTALGLNAVAHASYPFLRLCGGLGWAALLIFCVRNGALRLLTAPLASVGRMAFSNYVLQTVCCTLLFLGYGLGHYGEYSRSKLMLVWLAVTAVQVVFSVAWLRWFRFGPLEWAWRALTYWQRPPFRRTAA